jgi:lysophospholipase L1-like esterase
VNRFCFLFLLGAYGAQAQQLDTVPNLPDHYRQRIEIFNREPVVTGGIIFLGNSITAGGNWKALLKDSALVNRGINGDNTFGVLNRIGNVTERKPIKVFVLIGINDLSKNIPDETIIENILSIVRRIQAASPATIVYVQSILPLNATNEKFPEKLAGKESHILTINQQLKKYAAKMRYTFVNLYDEFTDVQGNLDEKFTADGLHLNKTGYIQWVSILRREKFL